MIKLLPEIIFEANAKNKPLGAYRVWFLAKEFDNGNGFIPKKDFKRHLKSLEIPTSTLHRWLDQAIELGLLQINGESYKLESWHGAARSVGVNRVLRFTKIPLDRFIRPHWQAWVFASYLTHFDGKPIARGTLEKLTGIPPRTQLEYEKHTSIEKTANYADICDREKNPDLAIEAMDFPGYYRAGSRIRKRLPNTYKTNGVLLANKGRTKQINKALSNEVSSQNTCYSLYCLNNQQRRRNIRKIQRDENSKTRPFMIFQHITNYSYGSEWVAIIF